MTEHCHTNTSDKNTKEWNRSSLASQQSPTTDRCGSRAERKADKERAGRADVKGSREDDLSRVKHRGGNEGGRSEARPW